MKVNAIVAKAIVFCVSYVCMQADVACADDTEQLQRRLYLRQVAINTIGDTWNNLSKQTKEDFIVGLRNNGLSEEDVCDIVSALNGVKSNAAVDARSSKKSQSRNFGGNQHNEAYMPNGTAFGFHGNNPYGEYVPVVGTGNTGIGVPSYNQPSEQLGSPGMWFTDWNEYHPKGRVFDPALNNPDVLRAAEISINASMNFLGKRASLLDERKADLEAYRTHLKDMKQMHELEIDRITGTTKAERKTMADNNLEEVYHRGAYGIADRLKRNRDTGDLYYVDDDGSIKKIYINGAPAKLDQ